MDNQRAMHMASNLVTDERLKHIHLGYHLIRVHASKGIIKLEYIGIEYNVADIMIKLVQKVKHIYFTTMLLHDQKV